MTSDLNTLQRALASRLIGLAEESLARGEVAEAERLYREVLHFLELILEPSHVEIGKTLYKLAYILEFQEKNAESLDLIGRARAIMRGADERERLNADAVLAPFVWERTS
jgi:hypothetical protein